ncbi:MAG: NADH-quinone oxidoreductase subunit M [Rhodospirillales bacterium]|nr:NADH-quinone oxidoreductase subunit M [Rhodospirillales bacterium]
MTTFPILSVTTFLPLVGAAFILLIRGTPEEVARNARWTALWVSLITCVVSLFIWFGFDSRTPDFQYQEEAQWIADFGITYRLGVDGISMLFIPLTTLLTIICVLASWESITERVREYMVAFLAMETMMVGMFSALDLFLFYIFFEGTLIPMFLIIGIWGGPRRVYSAFKFFLYTLAGSVLMLLAMLAIYSEAGTTSIPVLMTHRFPESMQTWLWIAFFASFAVKVPMWPVHTWLPDAHVEAPTAGSVILAGVLLKFGGYGFLRFSLPMFPVASIELAPFVFGLSIIAVIYTSLVALAQEDMKKLIAYSSVAHMGFVTAGTFTFTPQGLQGAIVQMLSHGLVSAALFLIVGVVYDRMHSRLIDSYGGLVSRMPAYAIAFMVFMLASVGLPGTSGFVGEILVLVGLYQVSPVAAALVATGVVLGAAYMLYLYRRIVFGKLTKDGLAKILDLSPREIAVFAPLILLVLWIGIYPAPVLDVMHASVENLISQIDAARGSALAMAGR